ncbi:uncharacterized protein LOC5567953 [Aedes aegypti]|uniref:Short form D7Cclu23 salivary protein n=1 Tax=Aedes aegypti TaxID=7159 RepID=Q95V89_AEDAE|nr:uncharacterized protein LOC5567953 [Aedes aegypti]AAL16050.1 short form D7Cclu23 salivary protein [Aedes aegypti]
MECLLYVYLLGILFSLSMALEVSHFYICSTDYVARERNFLCHTANFKLVSLPPKGDEFFDCCFQTSEWMDRGSKELKTNKFVSDMKKYGFDKRKAIEKVVQSCKTEMGDKINGWAYFRCFVMDRKISNGFKKMLEKKERRFFTEKPFCK